MSAVAVHVAIAGNPNTGKTTLFNRLTGLSARVGNYPGVTVDRETGSLKLPHSGAIEVIDVPGTYSLTARSAEELLAIQAICGIHPLERPDAVVLVVDATQLSRNLYLVLQVIETDVPVIIALNMVDLLEARGMTLDVASLSKALGVPVVPLSAQQGTGVEELKAGLERLLGRRLEGRPGPRWFPSSDALKADIDAVATALPVEWKIDEPRRRNAFGLWALLSLDEHDELGGVPQALREKVIAQRALATTQGRDIETEVIQGRYQWIDAHVGTFVTQKTGRPASRTDRIDRVLLHPVLGFALFVLVMGLAFQALFQGSEPLVSLITSGVAWLKHLTLTTLPPGLAADFISDALLEGVGSVLVFLPQIVFLFLFIGVMEDTGYMARVAFLMDRLMKVIGLHGRAFVPMMSGFACAVPAVLATRTMERKRDRMLTMMVIPLMTCSARLPVYSLIIAALFPPVKLFGVVPAQGLLMVAMYLVSTVMALGVAAVLGRTIFKGPRVPLLMEMPPYRAPAWGSIFKVVWRKVRVFLTDAGTVILACAAGMWVLLSFPHSAELEAKYAAERARIEASVKEPVAQAEQLGALKNQHLSDALTHSFGGMIGRAMEPVIRPLGFDWKLGIGLLGAFAAREVFVSTMGVVYGMGSGVDETSVGLRDRLRAETKADGRPTYTPLVGLSLLTFFAIACQCSSTLAVVRRETKSLKWPAFLLGYTLALAWLLAFAVRQGGLLLGFS